MDPNLTFYRQHKDSLIEQYDSVSFESVHQDWIAYLPNEGTALDIGAGSGRDARYLAKNGLKVIAVEPVLALLNAAKANSQGVGITWLQDSLPHLEKSKQLKAKFDLILLSAVWMHLSCEERKLSMQNMSSLLNTGGKLVITLRHGEFSDDRVAYPLSAEAVIKLASANGLHKLLLSELNPDQLGRGEVAWQTLVLGK